MLRERYEIFVHYDFSDVDIEEDSVNTLIIEQVRDGGFKRRVITNHEEMGDIILKPKQRQGWEEAEEYNSDGEVAPFAQKGDELSLNITIN